MALPIPVTSELAFHAHPWRRSHLRRLNHHGVVHACLQGFLYIRVQFLQETFGQMLSYMELNFWSLGLV
jgi:hypothetical protein